MTREEAKGSLIAIKNKYLANYGKDSIINILIDEYDIQAIDVAIKALEQTQWIPCSERLPKTDNKNSINSSNVLLWVKNKAHPEREAQFYLGKLKHVDGDDGSGNFWGIETKPCEWTIWGWPYFNEPEVIAWMPLPEPWKGESMTREEAKAVFLNRGYAEVEGGTIYDADKWRESCRVISEWLEQEPCEDTISRQNDILPNIDKKVESYKKLLKHPVIKSIMGMDETPVTLSVSENPNNCDLISREAVEEIITDIRNCISVEGYWAILERMKKLPSVKPQESCDVPDTNDGKMSENSTGTKDVIWYSKRNYSEIVVEPQERSK